MTPGVAIAELTYDAEKELLQGTIGKELPFNITAYSGGSRGHSAHVSKEQSKLYLHSEATSLFSHFANTATRGHGSKDDPYKQRGGTLPPGHYARRYIANHKVFHDCVHLHRSADTFIHFPTVSGGLNNRGDDFFIHGRGKKGSDGCIVPASETERLRLTHAIQNYDGKVILLVKHVAYLLPAERDDIKLA